MAGDWIKLRKCLFSHPKVGRIGRASSMSEPQVVGWLAKVWCWADEHTDDGTVANLSLEDIHRLTLAPEKFLAAMRQVGWVVDSKEGVSFPEFDAHMSDNSKRREQKTLQKQLERLRKQVEAAEKDVANLSPTCRPNVVPREEKRREEKRREETKLTAAASARTKSAPLEGDAWQAVAAAAADISDFSVDCLTRARDAGCPPAEVLDVLEFWHAHQTDFGVGALYNRIAAAVPGLPADQGWPTPKARRRPRDKAEHISRKRYRLIKAGVEEARDMSDDEIRAHPEQPIKQS